MVNDAVLKQVNEVLALFIKLAPKYYLKSMLYYNDLKYNKSRDFIDDILTYIDDVPKFKILQTGNMGLVVEYNDYVIKIFHMDKLYPKREKIILREIRIIYELFFSNSKVPKSLNKICGYCSENKIYSKENVMSEIDMKLDREIEKKLDALEKENIYGVLPDGFDYNPVILNDEYVYYFMEKSGGDMFGYYRDNISDNGDSLKLRFIKNYFTDMLEAVSYLHSKKFIHNDIKQENILVYEVGDNFRFQLIDYGGVTKLNDKGYCEINTDVVLTPEFIYGTKFYYTETTTKEYDWYCIVTTLLDSLDYFDSRAVVPTYGIYKNTQIYVLTLYDKLFVGVDKNRIENDIKLLLKNELKKYPNVIEILTKISCHFYIESDVEYNIIPICNMSIVTPSAEYRMRLKNRYRSTLQQSHNKIADFKKLVNIFLNIKIL